MLSAEAKVFVPRQQQGSTDVVENGLLSPGAAGTAMTDGLLEAEGPYQGQHPINGLPSYITTCYPFVNGAEPRYYFNCLFHDDLMQSVGGQLFSDSSGFLRSFSCLFWILHV